MRRRIVIGLLFIVLLPLSLVANDTVYVSGGLQHDGLMEFKPVRYLSNSYFDLGVHYVNDSNNAHFHSLYARTRLELTQWPLPGYEADFNGYGMSHLSVESAFDWGEITIGDVYSQFGSGLILNLYEDRAMGIDGALRGAKFTLMPYKGIQLTMLGGKQRRYWNCYKDHAFGWNYKRDAMMGADLELYIDQWSTKMQEKDVRLMIGGSYVSKYEAFDTILTYVDEQLYMYNLPLWVGAGDVRAKVMVKGFEALFEYATKAPDPCLENNYSYRWGNAYLASLGYSQKGLSVLVQAKLTDNMAFRSERQRIGIAGRLNHLPAFAQQHTYALASLYPYATQYSDKELAVQGEVRYTAPRKTKFGGKYGTTLKLSGSHIRVLKEQQGTEAYTDINIELNKRLSKNWWLNAMLMYQAYNRTIAEGHGGLIRSGIAVVDARVRINDNVSMRGELQYLYTPHYEGQWVFALYELTLYRHWTLSGQWLYNIGYASEATNKHYYTAGLTFTYGAHRANLGYTKTREGFNCSGGICRYVPQMEGMCVNYSFTF